MDKTKIVIASILKPIDDTRAFEKMAISLGQTNKYQINIIGFSAKIPATDLDIHFHPIFNFKRLSIGRLFAPLKYFSLLLKLKPEVIIVNTYEILIVTCLYRIIFGGKIVYDVQENYYRNLLHSEEHSVFIRTLSAIAVRSIEYLSSPVIAHNLLAERNYEQEFSFTKGKSTIIENKFKKLGEISRKEKMQDNTIQLLYSGTIAESYGIFDAITLAEKLHAIDHNIRLKIIGYCASQNTLNKISQLINNKSFIEVLGGNKLIAHQDILTAIQEADFGLISYKPNKSTENCIPTRIYEYLGLQLPFVLPKNPHWEETCQPFNACISIDYMNYDAGDILTQLKTKTFYDTTPPDPNIYWESEAKKLLQVVEALS